MCNGRTRDSTQERRLLHQFNGKNQATARLTASPRPAAPRPTSRYKNHHQQTDDIFTTALYLLSSPTPPHQEDTLHQNASVAFSSPTTSKLHHPLSCLSAYCCAPSVFFRRRLRLQCSISRDQFGFSFYVCMLSYLLCCITPGANIARLLLLR